MEETASRVVLGKRRDRPQQGGCVLCLLWLWARGAAPAGRVICGRFWTRVRLAIAARSWPRGSLQNRLAEGGTGLGRARGGEETWQGRRRCEDGGARIKRGFQRECCRIASAVTQGLGGGHAGHRWRLPRRLSWRQQGEGATLMRKGEGATRAECRAKGDGATATQAQMQRRSTGWGPGEREPGFHQGETAAHIFDMALLCCVLTSILFLLPFHPPQLLSTAGEGHLCSTGL